MNSPYLDSTLKEYYRKDWKEVLKCEDSSWVLDDQLVAEICTEINTHPNFATLYSKRFQFSNGEFSVDKKSYLQLAYSKSVQVSLKHFLERMKLSHNQENSLTISFSTDYNYRNANSIKKDSRLGCRNNPDYFKVKHVIIELESENEEDHLAFWKKLREIAQITS
jgi:hypothetical protein